MEVGKNEPFTSKENLMTIIRDTATKLKTDEAFYVADLSDVIEKYSYWKRKLPRVHPFFAVKTNSEIPFLRFMSSLGASFDCSSKEEIEWAMAAGAVPSEIIFAHTYKMPSHLLHAKSIGVDLMTFDSEGELLKIQEIYPDARLLLRFRVPNVYSAFPLDNKFGCEMEECRPLLELARHLGLSVVGTCFHVGGLCKDPTAFTRAIEMARDVFNLAKGIGFNFTLLDIGGGYPGHSECYGEFDMMCQCINQALEKHFSDDPNLRIIAEPGCYFSCSAFNLCTYVLGKRKVKSHENDRVQDKVMYYLNDGIYGSFFLKYEEYKVEPWPLLAERQRNERRVLPSKLWGYTCCPEDYITQECSFPEMNVGEYIIFDNMGAYTLSIISTFNGFAKPIVHYVYSGRTRLDKCIERQTTGDSTCAEKKNCVTLDQGTVCTA